MEQCSICLESLDGGVVALACNHRFHAACLAEMAGAVGTATTRRGSLTACPNCRTVSRVATVTTPAFSVGDRVLALWGHKFYPGVVDEVVDGGGAYEIKWDDGDVGRVLAKNVRAEAPAPVRPSPRRPAAAPARPAQRRPAVAPAPGAPPEEEPARRSTAAPTSRQPSMRGNTSRFTGVRRYHSPGGKWRALISVRGTRVDLGYFDDEEDAARAYDAALVKYKGLQTLNFPGEAPLASVLAALPELDDAAQHGPTASSEYDAIVAAAASDTAAPRQERPLAARRRVVASTPPQIKMSEGVPKACEMRRVGDAEWRWFKSQSDAAKAFGVSQPDVSQLVRNVSWAKLRETFEARLAPPRKRERPTKGKADSAPPKKPRFVSRQVEGARSKSNGKWVNIVMFPGREFDDLDAYRAAKKQRAARRAAWTAQARDNNYR